MAQPDRWSLLFATLRGDETIDSFGCSISQLDRYIGRNGVLSATIPIPNPVVGKRVEPVRWGEGHTAMYAMRGLEIWWGGMLNTCTASGGRNSSQLQVDGTSFEGYADRREIRADWIQTGVEQLELARMIWEAIQARPEGDLGIDIPAVDPSGQLRDYSALRSDVTTWGSALAEISGRANGFEWIIDLASDELGNRARQLLLGYPQISREGQTSYVLSMPGSVISYTWPGDATLGGTAFQARGDPPAATASDVTTQQQPLMSAIVEATDLLANGWPLYDVTTDRQGVSDPDTLDGWAQELADTESGSIRIPGIVARIDDLSPAILGAQIKLNVTDNLHPAQSDGTPGVTGMGRCVGYSIKPADRGTDDEVTVVLENPTDVLSED